MKVKLNNNIDFWIMGKQFSFTCNLYYFLKDDIENFYNNNEFFFTLIDGYIDKHLKKKQGLFGEVWEEDVVLDAGTW